MFTFAITVLSYLVIGIAALFIEDRLTRMIVVQMLMAAYCIWLVIHVSKKCERLQE